MSSFDPSTRITLPREELLQFFGKMALPPWINEHGQPIGGGIDCAPIATEISDWLSEHEIHAAPTTITERVRVSASYFLQGRELEGVMVGRDGAGITVCDDKERVWFLPWSSVGKVLFDPAHASEDAF